MTDDYTAVRTTIGLVVENIDALIDCMKAENARLLALLDTHPWAAGFEKAGYGFSPITTSDMCCGCGNYDVCDGIQTAMTICPEYLKEKPKEGMADLRGTVEPVGVTYTREDVQDWVTHAEMHDYVEKAIARALYPRRASQDDGDAE